MIVFMIGGCGRVSFDPLRDSGTSDSTADALRFCDATAPFTSIGELTDLSTDTLDGALRLSNDELTGYFHRTVGTTLKIFTASRADRTAPFGPSTIVVAGMSEWPTVTEDGLTIVYEGVNGLTMATRTSAADMFTNPVDVGSLNSVPDGISPIFTHDGTHLYYVRQEATALIYSVPWPAATPETSLPELATTNVLQAPVLSTDELTIYFGMEDTGTNTRIWRASRPDVSQPFGAPVTVDELNMGSNNSPTWMSTDQCRLYFESDRLSNFNLYVAERTPN